jgi:hypothetical protein
VIEKETVSFIATYDNQVRVKVTPWISFNIFISNTV